VKLIDRNGALGGNDMVGRLERNEILILMQLLSSIIPLNGFCDLTAGALDGMIPNWTL